jgi:putative intracellular protease/amidase
MKPKTLGMLFSLALLAGAAGAAGVAPAQAATKGKVLVVLSSAEQLQLRDGKTYRTGYYLDELEIPLRKLIQAGYTPVFASPKGVYVTFDPVSNDKVFYNNSEAGLADAIRFIEGVPGLKHPRTLASVAQEGTADYVGVFIPGGFAPMEDLVVDPSLGAILRSFHANGRPTGIICHGPAALLSAIGNAPAFSKAMADGDFGGASAIAKDWPYAGYRITIFSSAEEKLVEGASGQLGGWVRYYAADALAQAGARVDHVGLWGVNVVEDREIVSGQQPFSSEAFGDALVKKLEAAKGGKG